MSGRKKKCSHDSDVNGAADVLAVCSQVRFTLYALQVVKHNHDFLHFTPWVEEVVTLSVKCKKSLTLYTFLKRQNGLSGWPRKAALE